MDEKIKELNLLLLYLAGWEEDSTKEPGKKVFRSWKWYLFEVLNELQDDDMIYQLPYVFPNGAPAFWAHGGTRPLGVKHEGRWVVFYHPVT